MSLTICSVCPFSCLSSLMGFNLGRMCHLIFDRWSFLWVSERRRSRRRKMELLTDSPVCHIWYNDVQSTVTTITTTRRKKGERKRKWVRAMRQGEWQWIHWSHWSHTHCRRPFDWYPSSMAKESSSLGGGNIHTRELDFGFANTCARQGGVTGRLLFLF